MRWGLAGGGGGGGGGGELGGKKKKKRKKKINLQNESNVYFTFENVH